MKIFLLLITILALATGASGQAAVFQGNEFYRNEQYGLAEEQYRKAYDNDPTDVNARFNLANALYKQKKYAEAIRHFNEMGAQGKDKEFRASSFYNAGVAHTHLKDWKAAVEAFRHALRLSPEDQQARENLQKAMAELKKQQDQQKKQQNQKNESRMSRREAEQQLKKLQEKEKQIQQRLQNKGQSGKSQGKDW
jgi:Ca-activated chloride channel family protein